MNDLAALMVPALAMALLHFLWQGALIGLVAWFGLALLRNARPQARYALACIALLACALLPVVNMALALQAGSPMPASPTAPPATAALLVAAPSAFDAGLLSTAPANAFAWIVVAWAAGAGLLSLRMMLGVLWVRRLCTDAVSEAGEELQARVGRLANRFGIRRAVDLRIVAIGESPVSAGWWRPVVLVPAAVAARMPADLLEALLAHELAHVRRHDYLVNLLQSAVEAMLFYHPVVWWLSHRIRVERELVADDLAADILGERRRLAIALSELDRVGNDRSPFPHPHFAQAAHGGHLMSRIQHLLRPQRRSVGATLVLPALGLLAASIALYAHAGYRPHSAPGASAAVSARVAPVPLAPTAPAAAPVPPSAPAPAPLPVPTATQGPVTAPGTPARVAVREVARDGSYALVRAGREGFSMTGSTDDIDDIRRARGSIDGDFIWLRRDGKAYVIRDAGTLARVEQPWQATDALDAQMRVLDRRMQPHQKEMEALQARMEHRQAAIEEPAAMRESQQRIEALSRQMEALGKRQEALSRQMIDGSEARRNELERRMEVLSSEQEGLARQMDQHARVMEETSRDLERRHAPMEAIGREMEAAARPMEAIGKDMETLGKQIEREAKVADRAIRAAIEDAMQRGLALPAPSRQ